MLSCFHHVGLFSVCLYILPNLEKANGCGAFCLFERGLLTIAAQISLTHQQSRKFWGIYKSSDKVDGQSRQNRIITLRAERLMI